MAWRPRQLTPRQLEERRLAAGRQLQAGHHSQAEIAREFGVSSAAVSRWAKRRRAAAGRLTGLRRRPHPGRPSRLSAAQWQRLLQWLAAGACRAGFDTERWTLPRIVRVIRRRFGVTYHPRSLTRPLRRQGWTPQRPATQARERDDALIEAWLTRDWPRIKKTLAAQGGRLPSWTKRVTRFGPA